MSCAPLRIYGSNFVGGESFPTAEVGFFEPFVKSGPEVAEDLCGFCSTQCGRGQDSVRREFLDDGTQCFRLSSTEFIQGDVGLSLETTLNGPGSLSVPNKQKSCCVHYAAPPLRCPVSQR